MPLFDVVVDETRHYEVTYRIDADTPEQALSMAEEGETVEEFGERLQGIINRGVNCDTVKQVPLYVRIEYDQQYQGGNYSGVGDVTFIPEQGLTDDNLHQRFEEKTGIDPRHIIHYTLDELYTAEGDPVG